MSLNINATAFQNFERLQTLTSQVLDHLETQIQGQQTDIRTENKSPGGLISGAWSQNSHMFKLLGELGAASAGTGVRLYYDA